ncbi:MAG: PIN domain-containing protein [Thermoplasmata archaeon]|nr:PIN domain-containing protein [Thermoplasmata archaeon]
MKALDTTVLLALLHGDRKIREVLRRLRGVEIAASELGFLELHILAAQAPVKERAHRREALDRLRRSLTVLPFDGKALEKVARRGVRDDLRSMPPSLLASLAIFEAAGCEEFITVEPASVTGRWAFRVSGLTPSEH